MSDAETMRVTMTLPREVGERLRGMCHARGTTASDLIERWVAEHDDRGYLLQPPNIIDAIFQGLRGRRS